MNSNKKCARVAGLLLIIATSASLLSSPFLGSISSSNYLTLASTAGNQLLFGVLLLFLSAVFSASIAISLYPVLKKYNETLALGAVVFRVIEGVFYTIGALCLILLLTLSQEFAKAGFPTSSHFQTLGVILLKSYHSANFVFGVMSFCVGALMYSFIFYQTQLIPRWLSGWGILGILLLLCMAVFILFGAKPSGAILLMAIPIAAQEIVLAVWLITKGFNQSAMSGS